jgi:hypothetical protein
VHHVAAARIGTRTVRRSEFLTANHGENTSLGIELDVGYDDSPIVCTTDTEAPPWDLRTFVPAVRPGHRAANVVVSDKRNAVRPIRRWLHPRRRRR